MYTHKYLLNYTSAVSNERLVMTARVQVHTVYAVIENEYIEKPHHASVLMARGGSFSHKIESAKPAQLS
jgi:hypothetical protein